MKCESATFTGFYEVMLSPQIPVTLALSLIFVSLLKFLFILINQKCRCAHIPVVSICVMAHFSLSSGKTFEVVVHDGITHMPIRGTIPTCLPQNYFDWVFIPNHAFGIFTDGFRK